MRWQKRGLIDGLVWVHKRRSARLLRRPLVYRRVYLWSHGRGPFCRVCGFFPCACAVMQKHTVECQYRLAATLVFSLPCPHGLQVCATCDACDCGAGEIMSRL